MNWTSDGLVVPLRVLNLKKKVDILFVYKYGQRFGQITLDINCNGPFQYISITVDHT